MKSCVYETAVEGLFLRKGNVTKKFEFAIQQIQEKRQLINTNDFFHVKWSMAYDKEYETGREVRLMVRKLFLSLNHFRVPLPLKLSKSTKHTFAFE